MRGLILRRKTGTVSVKVFTFHVHLAFERHTGTEGSEPLLSCSVYFVRIPLPFELIFLHQCPKDYCFDVIHHALKIQRKTVVQTKLKQHVITGLYYLRHISAGIEKHSRLMKQIISSLQYSSQCLAICKLCTSSCNNFMFCTVRL